MENNILYLLTRLANIVDKHNHQNRADISNFLCRQHLLKDEDESLKRTPTGFIVERERRDPFVYEGKIDDLKIIRDECILEVFVNGGQEIFSILL